VVVAALVASGLTLPAGPAVAEEPDETAPMITILSPESLMPVGASPTFQRDEVVSTDFVCEDFTEGADAVSGVAACTLRVFRAGPEGEELEVLGEGLSSGAVLPTATPGTYVVSYSSTDMVGNLNSVVRYYRVIAPDVTPPTITIAAPIDGAEVELGAEVLADYTCTDEDGGSGVAACDGPVDAGSPIDTSTTGTFTFEVSATDTAGNPASESVSYTVTESVDDVPWSTVSGRVLVGGSGPAGDVRLSCPASDSQDSSGIGPSGQFTVQVLPAEDCTLTVDSTDTYGFLTVSGINATTDTTLPDISIPGHTLNVTVRTPSGALAPEV
jgi:hypothetical protein